MKTMGKTKETLREHFSYNLKKYSLHEINLAFKVFCSLKKRVQKRKRKGSMFSWFYTIYLFDLIPSTSMEVLKRMFNMIQDDSSSKIKIKGRIDHLAFFLFKILSIRTLNSKGAISPSLLISWPQTNSNTSYLVILLVFPISWRVSSRNLVRSALESFPSLFESYFSKIWSMRLLIT